MPRAANPSVPAGRSRFHGALRWLILSVVGIVIAASGIIMRITTGGPGSYDIVFSFGMLLVITGIAIAGFTAYRQQLK